MTAKEGVSQRSKYKKTEHSEIKQFGNNNNSVPKSKSILNKFEKGEVLRWSLRKKNPAAHTVPTRYCCVETLLKTHKKYRTSYTGLSAVSTILSWERVDWELVHKLFDIYLYLVTSINVFCALGLCFRVLLLKILQTKRFSCVETLLKTHKQRLQKK